MNVIIDINLIKHYINTKDVSKIIYKTKTKEYEPEKLVIGNETIWEGFTYDGLTFELLGDGTYALVASDNTITGAIEIPPSYNGKPVTVISNSAFFARSKLTGVVIPGSITTINQVAFKDCTALEQVIIEDSIDTNLSINSSAFRGCTTLSRVILPSNLTYIGFGAFRDCDSLASVVIPDGVTSIDGHAFYGCDSLVSVVIGDSVTSIGTSAFSECYSLTEVYYNGTAAEWNNIYIYNGNTYLTNATRYYYSETKPTTSGNFWHWNEDGEPTVWEGHVHTEEIIPAVTPTCTTTGLTEGKKCSECGEILVAQTVVNALGHTEVIDKAVAATCTETGLTEGKHCSVCGEVLVEQEVVPATGHHYVDGKCTVCGGIDLSRFEFTLLDDDTYSVKAGEGLVGNVEIPSTYNDKAVTRIDRDGFEKQTGIISVIIPSSVTYIGISAFSYCSNLRNVDIPDSVTHIGSSAFYGCTSLTSVDMPDNLAFIETGTFYGCSSLTRVVMGDGISSIASTAFYGCTSLDGVVIPNGVTYIGVQAFSDCSSLTSIVIPSSVNFIGNVAFWNCKNLSNVTIENGVTSIGTQSFAYCSSLTSVIIPNSVTTIGKEAFWNCNSLSNVVFGDGVTSIGDWAFSSCSSLVSVVIPDNVASIGHSAFRACDNLTSVVIGESVASIGAYAFYGCSKLTIEVAEGNTAYYVENNCLYETSTYKLIFANAKTTISSTTTAIGEGAFGGTHYAPIKIPLSVEFIESHAFSECENLVVYVEATSKPEGWADDWHDGSVTVVYCFNYSLLEGQVTTYAISPKSNNLPENLVIPSVYKGIPISHVDGFGYCDTIKTLEFERGSQVQTIGASAFMYCSNLEGVSLPDSVSYIQDAAFAHCDKLKAVNVTSTSDLDAIGSQAFMECYSLVDITNLLAKVTEIHNETFQGCTQLPNVTLCPELDAIGDRAFDACYGFTTIHIPEYVYSIGECAFRGCINVETITVNANNPNYHIDGNCLIETETNTVVFGCKNSVIPSTVSSIRAGAFYGNTYFSPVKIPLSVSVIGSLAFGGEPVTVYVEATSKPVGWDDGWCDDSVTVVWGYTDNTRILTESGDYLTDEQGNRLII